ncbi:uncharacterized protein GGS25DRAFT_143678 [Hypoxylon fragiforme]|uniref:uncharacterized protein n=1 Tax=Hypoxylon fragiforme TaxID=63214 RepID=UPI0020C64ADD|nr:uncharacterized protein GGS25DRAFT_143678 [Hypoxylon fragiforme]KAI2612968.1 hypothetical protein GGS25DRAFT_143678 [Hypoxylon fragiforme]
MAHRRPRPRKRFLNFMALLAVASSPIASALNMSQFQLITSGQISKRCIRAYQANIDGCKRSDFTDGHLCSASCVAGLQKAADTIEGACGDLSVTSGSLLGIILSGGVVNALCPGSPGTTTVRVTVQPTSTKGFSTIPTSTSDDITSTTSSSKKTQSKTTLSISSSDAESTSLVSTSLPAPSSSTEDTTTTIQTTPSPSPTPSPTATSEAVQTPPATSSASTQEARPKPFIGGSPFDPSPIQDSEAICLGYEARILAVGILVVAILLQ